MAKKVAVVTGGIGGLGESITTKMADAGYQVVVTYSPSNTKYKSWLDEMKGKGYAFKAYPVDVVAFDDCAAKCAKIQKECGNIDILVNNAGITRDAIFKRMTERDWLEVIGTNLNSVFNVTRQVVDGMTERGWGRIINISSVNGLKGQFGQTNYSAAKAGMAGFSKALAQEVVKKGVTVNTISPGYVETDLVRAIRADVRQQIIDSIPMGRLARPEEIAAVVAFLASEEAGYNTGANISVNGGMHMM